jgi:hypothetical protein
MRQFYLFSSGFFPTTLECMGTLDETTSTVYALKLKMRKGYIYLMRCLPGWY